MTSVNNKIFIDFGDWEQLRFLMGKFGDTESMMPGKNERGESQSISFYPTRIVLVTFQNNGFERVNTYWHSGVQEETFNGRWK